MISTIRVKEAVEDDIKAPGAVVADSVIAEKGAGFVLLVQ